MSLTGAPPRGESPREAATAPPEASRALRPDRPFGLSRAACAALAVVYAAFQSLLSSIDTAPALDALGKEGFLRKVGQTASNFAHVPLFAGFAALAFFAIAPRGRRDLERPSGPALTLLAALLFGVADEIHQAFVPSRFPSLLDVGSDVVGAALALVLLGAFGTTRRARLAGVVPLAAAGLVLSAVAAVGNDPGVVPFRRLADRVRGYPENEFRAALDDARAWRRNVPEPALTVEVAATPSGHEIRLSLPPSPWPGVVTRSIPFDWRGYRSLEVGLRNDSTVPLVAGVRVDDLADRRHEETAPLPPGDATLDFPLEPFAASVDMSEVDTLLVHLVGNDATRSIAITSVRLLK